MTKINRRAGFTLIELMIVVAIIAIVASIAIPNLIAARLNANEISAISTCRAISTAQAQFSKACYADENGDGAGEYGSFGELSGVVLIRGTTRRGISDLTASMAMVTANGEVQRSGYIYRLYLPNSAGLGVTDLPGGGITAGTLAPDLAQLYWCCYSFPITYENSGRRTFFVNQHGELLTTEERTYQAPACTALHAGAALRNGAIDAITGDIAVGTIGLDGHRWRSVQ